MIQLYELHIIIIQAIFLHLKYQFQLQAIHMYINAKYIFEFKSNKVYAKITFAWMNQKFDWIFCELLFRACVSVCLCMFHHIWSHILFHLRYFPFFVLPIEMMYILQAQSGTVSNSNRKYWLYRLQFHLFLIVLFICCFIS